MNKKYILLLFFVIIYSLNGIQAQTYGESLTLQVQATVQTAPAQIKLNWPSDINATSYQVFRKDKTSLNWGTALGTLAASDTQYADNTVILDSIYEYKVVMNPGAATVKYGYIASGINVRANSNHGIAIVVVEDSFVVNPTFETALQQLALDLELDGWFPKLIYVHRTDLVTDVKTKIINIYNEDPIHSKLLLLLGNVPVPYSGNLNPDGHPDHEGAWPTDNYYADIDGDWTDVSINNSVAGDPRNRNIPGDGKFDPSMIPSDLELETGRIDLSDLPDFALNEESLLLKYLDKLHRYKTANLIVSEKAIVDDGFTGYPEGFSQNGYRNFSALVGRNNIVQDDYFTQTSYATSTSGTYKWSFGCGGGWYSGAGGIGNTANFAADSLSSVFTMLFGSYFGDWNVPSSFLRAPLAQGNTLTNCWAGRPNWHLHDMAMGENIGYSGLLSQNNLTTYFMSTLGAGMSRLVSINLMGDPSLRDNYLIAPTHLQIHTIAKVSTLTWQKGDTETGYNIYRRLSGTANFEKLNTSPITDTTFTDHTLYATGIVYYYVKAVKQHISPTGSYDNESLAARDSTLSYSNVGIDDISTTQSFIVFPNPTKEFCTVVTSGSVNAIQQYTVVNSLGEVLLKGQFTGNSTTINLKELATGIYYLQILNGDSQVIKMVKE